MVATPDLELIAVVKVLRDAGLDPTVIAIEPNADVNNRDTKTK